MNQEALNNFQIVVHELFIRWDALKLAVEHTRRRNGQQEAREIRDYIFDYCIHNDNVHSSELVDKLNEEIDAEFQTICEDNSVEDLSNHLVEYLKLCKQGKFDEVRHHLSQMYNCVNWLDPNFTITPAPRGSDSDSESGSDDDMDMSDDDDDNEPQSNHRNQRNRPTTDEDGWTTIPTRRR